MVATPSQTDTYNTALDIFDRTHPLRVDADENLKVTGDFTFTPSGTQNVFVTNTIPVSTKPSTDAVGSEETVFTTLTALLAPNANRLGLIIQISSMAVSIFFGSTSVPTYVLPPNSILEVENFTGAVLGEVVSGSTTITVTEKI